MSPTLAPTKGGGIVTLTGTAYDRVSAVTFGGVAGDRGYAACRRPSFGSPCRPTPRATSTCASRPPVAPRPVVPAGRFTFQDPPVVASVTPASGPLAGGTVVTLRGTSFTDVSGGAVRRRRRDVLHPGLRNRR